jgi:hypothetical protein
VNGVGAIARRVLCRARAVEAHGRLAQRIDPIIAQRDGAYRLAPAGQAAPTSLLFSDPLPP